jgi:hypothetical protein
VNAPPLDRALYAARGLVQELRHQGLAIEAEILAQALAVASAATTNREAYHHALIALSDLVCERLDDLEREDTAVPSLN